jgi:RNA polymerase sigma factor (sigma-70 family)
VRSRQSGSVYRHLHTLFDAGTVAGLTDRELLERFANRNGEVAELAFAALVERHGPMVLRTCRRTLRDHHDAQDAFQATFLVLVRKARSLWVQDSLGPWLYNVACRVAAYSKVSRARRSMHEQKCAVMPNADTEGDSRDDLSQVLHEEISRLPESLRVVVVLCYLQGQTHEQTALQLGWPVGTVRSRLARAREHIRTRLIRRGLAPSVGLLTAALSAESASAGLPASLMGSTVQIAMRVTAGNAASAGMVSASVATLTTGVLRVMFLTKMKSIIGVALILGFVATDAAVLAQPGPEAVQQEALDTGASSLNFEIRTWKGGKESGEPITVEMVGQSLHQIETPDAVIQIRPRHNHGYAGPLTEVTKADLRGSRSRPDEAKRAPETPDMTRQEGGKRPPIYDRLLGEALTKEAPTRNQALGEALLGLTREPSEQERRLEQVERKLDMILRNSNNTQLHGSNKSISNR